MQYTKVNNKSKSNRLQFWIGVLVLIIGLSVLQDFLFSNIRDTGFYLSDSLLYNSIWIFLVPLTFLEIGFLACFPLKNRIGLVLATLATSLVFTLLHLLIFTSFFVSVSHLVFSPAHRFSRIFYSALSSEFSILALYYCALPLVSRFQKGTLPSPLDDQGYPSIIKVKKGLKTVGIPVEAIQVISTDKPYTIIVTDGSTFLDNRTLKDFETVLDPGIFLRVNRSAILNEHFVMEVVSRKNGDYDAVLRNRTTVRLSRHYRTNWRHLLQ